MTNLPNPFPGTPSHAPVAGSNGTLVVFLLDNSGSMGGVVSQTREGFDSFVNGQRNDKTKMTLSFFGTYHRYIFQNIPSVDVKSLATYGYNADGGGTALNDSFAEAIRDTDKFLSDLPEEVRPSVTFVVITDGEENSSREFKDKKIIQKMVKDRIASKWDFTYLGANVDAFAEAASYGIAASAAASYNASHTKQAFASVSRLASSYSTARGMSLDTADIGYTDEERTMMKGGE